MSVPAEVIPLPEPGATEYANKLLTDLGCAQVLVSGLASEHSALTWARSGLMLLTGNDSPQMCPAPLAAGADGVLEALKSFGNHELRHVTGSHLLSERAALMDIQRAGRIAPGGSCRLLDTADGRLAINLARDEDWAMLPAWLETDEIEGRPGQWEKLEVLVAARSVDELVEQGRVLGLPIAKDAMPERVDDWYKTIVTGTPAIPGKQPLVIDLSALWAGPLCGHLLQKSGARVIKVESTTRPDGAREGNADFYDLLNSGKESVSLDLISETGREQLLGLIARADIVIESARPRGLQQMGIDAEALVANQPGLTWVSISAYGREGEQANWVGFGDDAAIAAGVSSLMEAVTGEPMFVGDAIADPLAGLHAALVAWATYQQGGGRLISLSLKDVVSHCLLFNLPSNLNVLNERQAEWSQLPAADDIRLPEPRTADRVAVRLGADTHKILTEFGLTTG